MESLKKDPDLYEIYEIKRILQQGLKCEKFWGDDARTAACIDRMIEEGTMPDELIKKGLMNIQ